MIQINDATFVTFGIVTLALASLWSPNTVFFSRFTSWVWLIILIIAIMAGMFFNILQPVALLWIVLFGGSAWALTQNTLGLSIKRTSFVMVLFLALGLLTHRLPGFTNPKIITALRFSQDALPYDKYLNFDSALVGLFIVGFGHQRLNSASEWWLTLKKMSPILLLTLVAVMLLSLVLGYVHWQPKWTPIFFIWAWGNLFFTCIIEEAFFRGFIQKYLMQGFSKISYGNALALSIAASLFGLVHYAGGIQYILLATVAGIGYGWAYQQTRQIEAAILTHFTLNSLHFLLFTYPALAAPL